MSKFFLLIFIIVCSTVANAQDTIFVKEQPPFLARVLEISANEVSYKNFFNPDGIIRKIDNTQIIKIIYENGIEESKFKLIEKTSGSNVNKLQPNLFVVEGKHIALNNVDITHKTAFKIMMKKNPHTNSDDLNEQLIIADSKKNGQIAFNIIAPVSALAGVYLARQHRYNDAQERLLARTYFISGLGVCAASIIIAQVYRSVKNKHIRKAAVLYNLEQ